VRHRGLQPHAVLGRSRGATRASSRSPRSLCFYKTARLLGGARAGLLATGDSHSGRFKCRPRGTGAARRSVERAPRDDPAAIKPDDRWKRARPVPGQGLWHPPLAQALAATFRGSGQELGYFGRHRADGPAVQRGELAQPGHRVRDLSTYPVTYKISDWKRPVSASSSLISYIVYQRRDHLARARRSAVDQIHDACPAAHLDPDCRPSCWHSCAIPAVLAQVVVMLASMAQQARLTATRGSSRLSTIAPPLRHPARQLLERVLCSPSPCRVAGDQKYLVPFRDGRGTSSPPAFSGPARLRGTACTGSSRSSASRCTSDMTGYGHLPPRTRWLELYWASSAVLLALAWRVSSGSAGTVVGLRSRLSVARARLTPAPSRSRAWRAFAGIRRPPGRTIFHTPT
jgi:hypothetical protein